MKKAFIFIVAAAGFMALSFSPSLDGRATVAPAGELPQGMFAKTVGYLPGDSLTVTNLAGHNTIDILVVGSLDPSQGVAISLSPEAANALGIKAGSDAMVKLTRRTGMMDEVVTGSAVITPSDSAVAKTPTADKADTKEDTASFTEPDDSAVPNPPETATPPAEDAVAIAPAVVPNTEKDETAAEDTSAGDTLASEDKPALAENTPAAENTASEELPPVEDAVPAESAIAAQKVIPVMTPPVEGAKDSSIPESPVSETPVAESGVSKSPVTEYTECSVTESAPLAAKTETPNEYKEYTADTAIESNPVAAQKEVPHKETAPYNTTAERDAALYEKAQSAPIIAAVPAPVEETTAVKERENTPVCEKEASTPVEETVAVKEDKVLPPPDEEAPYAPIVLVPAEPKTPPEKEESAPVAEKKEKEESAPVVAIHAPPAVESTPKLDDIESLTKNSIGALEKGAYYVQFATFAKRSNTKEALQRYGKAYPMVFVPNKKSMQALIGPLTVDEYGAVLERFKSDGFKDAFLRKIK